MRMRTGVAVAAVVVGGAAVGTLLGTSLSLASAHPSQMQASVQGYVDTPSGRLPHAFINLSAYPDAVAGEHGSSGGAHPDWVSYGPTTNLKVPAHSVVTMTIDQYDTGETITDPYFATVQGTLGGTATVNGKAVTHIDPTDVAHTFTLHMFPANQPDMFISVPLPGVSENAQNQANGYPKPNVVTFSFITGAAGTYVWNCEYPCGTLYAKFGGPMSTLGYMDGTLTVG
jgi:hypothetical protein